MRNIICAVFLMLPASLAAQTDSSVVLNRLRAVVVDKPIFQSMLVREYELKMVRERRAARPDSATAVTEMKELLNHLVDVEVLMQVAVTEQVTLPDDAVEREIDNRMKEARGGFGSEREFVDELRKSGFNSVDEFRRFNEDILKRQEVPSMLLAQLRRSGRLPNVTVPDSEVNAIADQQRSLGQLGRKPATVSFRQIMIPTRPSQKARDAARAKAESLLLVLHGGADFDSLARTEGMDSTRSSGGDLGWHKRGDFVAEFDRWLFLLDPGRFSPVFETRYGFHIVKVDRKRPAEVQGRHILIRPALDSTDVAAGRMLADSIATKLRDGAPFDSLLERYNEKLMNPSPAFPNYARDSLPAPYAEAFRDVATGGGTAVFTTPDAVTDQPAFVVAVITARSEGGEYTTEEVRDMVRRSMQNAAAIKAYLEKVKKQMYIRIFN